MKIILKSLSIKNFRGIKELDINFSDTETAIFGANKTGKSTTMDAFLWLLFSKDSQNRLDFEIKTRKKDGATVNRVDHEVSAILAIGEEGRVVLLRKVYREKWVKSKGELEAAFTGHEKEHYYDNVPLSSGEYKTKIDALVPEERFKLLTNTLYFNENITWQKRREVLQKIAGDVKEEQVYEKLDGLSDPQKLQILNFSSSGKTLSERKAELKSSSKILSKELENVPVKINEVENMLPGLSDFDQIEKDIEAELSLLADIEAQITDKAKLHQATFERIQKGVNEVNELKLELQHLKNTYVLEQETIRTAHNKQASTRKNRIEELAMDIRQKSGLLDSTSTQILSSNAQRVTLRDLFDQTSKSVLTFNENEFNCPTCNRPLEEENKAEHTQVLVSAFNATKATKIAGIREEGTGHKTKVEQLEGIREGLQTAIAKLFAEHKTLQEKEIEVFELAPDHIEDILAGSSDYQALKSKIKTLESVTALNPILDIEALKIQKSITQLSIDVKKAELSNKSIIIKGHARIDALEASEKQLAFQIAEIEGENFTLDLYNKAKIQVITDSVNKRFEYVKFEMFTSNINGGYDNDCVTTMDGTRWDTLNTAAKVQAGLDIINTLSDFYGDVCPVFIDNRESVSLIPATPSQIINLVVSAEDVVLRTEHI